MNPKDASNPQFNGEDANGAIFGTVALDKTFYQKYPTIYHLRAELINNPAKADLREVYLAIHHIVKYRGHFLNSAEKIDTNQTFDVASLQTALVNYAEHLDDPTEFLSISDENQFAEAIQNQLLRKKERQEKATTFVEGNTKMISQLTGALLGYTVNLEVLFSLTDIDKEDKNKYKVQFDDEELDDKLSEATALSEEQLELIAVLRRAYAGLQLKQILGDKQSISEAMIARYQAHAEQLKWLKNIASIKINILMKIIKIGWPKKMLIM
ncbi:CRISPR-associated endonuclease Cas9 REC1/REC2 domain-containing protein [Leuconostoc lactis]|uniref:CRISPR-associated endonuclease Cas9 REC1/REC2 domain-containing protein n=1 Tax=Leuconostoc lactis TaxID=1246 RepID=UPI00241E9960|nr:CRISPR-associated endonuclease Cas9 REC1/REC2 domain-containing protein [Leuconostoc lactis]